MTCTFISVKMLNIQKVRPVVARAIICRKICSKPKSSKAYVCLVDQSQHPVSNVPNLRPFSTNIVRMSNEGGEDSAPKKILFEQNFKVPSFGGILVFKAPVNIQVRFSLWQSCGFQPLLWGTQVLLGILQLLPEKANLLSPARNI